MRNPTLCEVGAATENRMETIPKVDDAGTESSTFDIVSMFSWPTDARTVRKAGYEECGSRGDRAAVKTEQNLGTHSRVGWDGVSRSRLPASL